MWNDVESGVERNTNEIRTNNSIVHIWIGNVLALTWDIILQAPLVVGSSLILITIVKTFLQGTKYTQITWLPLAKTLSAFWGDVLSWKGTSVCCALWDNSRPLVLNQIHEHPQHVSNPNYKPFSSRMHSCSLLQALTTVGWSTNTMCDSSSSSSMPPYFSFLTLDLILPPSLFLLKFTLQDLGPLSMAFVLHAAKLMPLWWVLSFATT